MEAGGVGGRGGTRLGEGGGWVGGDRGGRGLGEGGDWGRRQGRNKAGGVIGREVIGEGGWGSYSRSSMCWLND